MLQISQSVPLCQWGCKLNIRWIVLWSFDICMYTHTHTHTPTSFALSGTGRQAKYTRVQRLRGEGNNDRRQRRKKVLAFPTAAETRPRCQLPVATVGSCDVAPVSSSLKSTPVRRRAQAQRQSENGDDDSTHGRAIKSNKSTTTATTTTTAMRAIFVLIKRNWHTKLIRCCCCCCDFFGGFLHFASRQKLQWSLFRCVCLCVCGVKRNVPTHTHTQSTAAPSLALSLFTSRGEVEVVGFSSRIVFVLLCFWQFQQ